jgi:hypothetical protein
MAAVCIPQHLHAIAAVLNNNKVAEGIERDARRMLELTGACPLAADCEDVRAVAVAQQLNTMVAAIGYNKVDFAVKRDSIARRILACLPAKLRRRRAQAHGARGRSCGMPWLSTAAAIVI